jgi:hypothetical protein
LASPEQWDASTPTASALVALTDNLLDVTTQGTVAIPSRTRYINNLFIGNIVVATGGSKVFYDEKSTEFVNIEVTESVATLKAAVNAL